ncbi:MAG: hypothetical protein ACOH5I_15405 [Oligoflexus sp.]
MLKKGMLVIIIVSIIPACKRSSQNSEQEALELETSSWYADKREIPPFEFDYHQALTNFPTGEDMRRRLCFDADPNALEELDPLRRAFCSPTPPSITSLKDLQKALGLEIPENLSAGKESNGVVGLSPGFALTGHSTSLVSRYVSPINPRVIIFSAPENASTPDPDFIVMGFVRGDQFVEIATREPRSGKLNFYLVDFKQDCNELGHCSNGHLQSSAIENNWTSINIISDKYLTNTVFDCTHCHQPEGVMSNKFLRMQELEKPWTHFFRDDTKGSELIQEFKEFHGDEESIGGIPAHLIASSDPEKLSWLIKANGFADQPNVFSSQSIESESAVNPGTTWIQGWQNYLNGASIPFPSWKTNILDQTAVVQLKSKWQAWRNGELALEDLPDLRYAIDDRLGPTMGTRAPKGIRAKELLQAACTRCHNDKLDQTLGKSLFSTNLDRMYSDQIQVAIDRIELLKTDPNSPLAMPPRLFMDLTDDEVNLLIEELKRIQ